MKNLKKPSLTVIIPAYNEVQAIRKAYESASKIVPDAGISDYEIILVTNTAPDGTHDGTPDVAAEIAKDQPAVRGSGDSGWTFIAGSGDTLSLADQTTDDFTTHDWYIGLTATPTSIGEKTNIGLYFETEFL